MRTDAMQKLTRDKLYTLEKYAEVRNDFRAQVIAHKKNRQVHIGPHASLYFEDFLTMQYQVQEMLRAEKIFEAEGIDEELAAYNPLIPDGSNWKATFMLEYSDENERRPALANMKGIEDKVWVRIAGFDPTWAIADEDMERDNADKTSAVHFLRFELTPDMIQAAKAGAAIGMGIDHPAYTQQVDPLPPEQRAVLLQDLAS